MQWGIRFFLVVVALLGLGIVALVLGLVVRPVAGEALRARVAGNGWLPFLPREDGTYGPLAANHWWSAFRADRPGSLLGLAVRWGFWAAMSLLLTGIAVYLVVGGARLLSSAW